jgi:hypothetical protein
MKPQRPQRKILCLQKDLPIKAISERQAAWKKPVKDEVMIERKAVRKGTGRGLKIDLFSVFSVVGF